MSEETFLLKSQLIELENKDSELINQDDLVKLVDQMLDNIGSIDSQLRDNLIFPTFVRLIDEELLNIEQYQYIFDTVLDEKHLFYNIGEKNTDSVFTRSFSSLIVAAILHKDNQLGFLSEECFNYAVCRSISYLKSEQDTRGLVEVKGWAHSVAHGADLLVALVRHPKFENGHSDKILNTIHNCLFKDATYIDEEDERLVFVIEALIEKEFDQKKLGHWAEGVLSDLEYIYANEGFSNRYFRIKFNITNFLKSLYFINGFKNEKFHLGELINQSLKILHQKLYDGNEVRN
ncbi:DUF2785 domain-containing protein [Ureibacillus aquaedulcis]|uniref:DUF2785 domain-containing protein n=1 Tax=Ureibacillus aquaedulcis TaxID=3058421 RepID=A0ABT8GMT7_9BACL|nr:DUF2785 domain-containing protein [Ureibacillus sp. BA0131]MDN4492616.1 DUF2785 domain-containing protein [Ureibacillus sp. BA0131]